ncbi:hypothetical protein EOM89_09575 [Candidatus Falkowbacteria bacterium]|nr:hypothetical protein [Candidatus Falkowbacteria bacterium]
MKQANSGALVVFGLVLIAGLGGALLARGALYLGMHEGDTLHLLDMALRMGLHGQWPHLDFMTPIGILAIAPIAGLVAMGLGIGTAILWAQVLVALVLLLPLVRMAGSRFGGLWSYVMLGYGVVLCLALVHGLANPAPSVSMHYNRWAWAIVYVVLPLALLPDRGRARPYLDGALIGLGVGALVLIKVTYAAALGPGILVALLVRREWRVLVVAVVAGCAVLAVMTALGGSGFWVAYLTDLLTVAQSETRPAPGGIDFADAVAGPANMPSSILALAVVVLLRMTGRKAEGLALLFLAPGLFYVTWQNFGNDPQWLLLLGAAVFALLRTDQPDSRHAGRLHDAMKIAGVAALALTASSAVNIAYSPIRHLFAEAGNTVPLLSALAGQDDIRVAEKRLYKVDAGVPLDGVGQPFAAYHDRADRKELSRLKGEVLPACELSTGYNAMFETIAADLEAQGHAGSAVLTADLLGSLWMFGDLKPLKGGAPWYYGGAPGLAAADLVVVPLCPTTEKSRATILAALEKSGWRFDELRRTDVYILLRPVRP